MLKRWFAVFGHRATPTLHRGTYSKNQPTEFQMILCHDLYKRPLHMGILHDNVAAIDLAILKTFRTAYVA